MFRKLQFAAVLAFATLTVAAAPAVTAAERPTAVVELFTSQGCNSCPPADAVLEKLADRPGVLALGFHVDYWDYLGWKDTLASAENTKRQRGYVKALGGRSVYTPQAVINGREHMNGAKGEKVEAAISASADALPVEVSMTRVGDSVVIEARPSPSGTMPKAHVLMVFFTPRAEVRIERGENAGKTMVYRNAVTTVQAAGWWKGAAGRWEIPMSEVDKHGGGAAVLLQSMKAGIPGPIMGAAMLQR